MAINAPSIEDLGALNSLTDEQRFWLAAGVNAQYSANAIQQSLSDAGLGARRQTIQAAVRAYTAIQELSSGINNTPLPFQPTETMFTPVTYGIGANYRIHAFVDAFVPSTGETRRVYVYVGMDTLLTRQQILEQAASDLNNAEQAYDLQFATEDIVIGTALRHVV